MKPVYFVRLIKIKPFFSGVDGCPRITTALTHQAVPHDDIIWLYEFMNPESGTKVAFDEAIHILRRKMFPFHYDPHPWIAGII